MLANSIYYKNSVFKPILLHCQWEYKLELHGNSFVLPCKLENLQHNLNPTILTLNTLKRTFSIYALEYCKNVHSGNTHDNKYLKITQIFLDNRLSILW